MMQADLSQDLLTWRAALEHAGRLPETAELFDWSFRLQAAGAEGPSQLLLRLAQLRTGIPARTSLLIAAGGQFGAAANENALTRATRELRQLARVHRPRLARQRAAIDLENDADAVDDLGSLVERLHATMQVDDSDSAEEAAMLLARIGRAGRVSRRFDYRRFAAAPLPVLAAAIARVVLADFALETNDLVVAPLGSPRFLQLVSRPQPGLGAYFSNVGRLARSAADIFDLARMAAESAQKSGDGDAQMLAWAVLLTRACPSGLVRHVIDELGDEGAVDALDLLLDRLIMRPDSIDLDLVLLIRDAALDNAAYRLAARAQAVGVGMRPDVGLEHIILGSIQASGGDFKQAELTFRRWLRSRPDDHDALERLSAAERHDFGRFLVLQGFGSPPERQRYRLRQRQLRAVRSEAVAG